MNRATDQARRRHRLRVVRVLFKLADEAERLGLRIDAWLLREQARERLDSAQRTARFRLRLRRRAA